MRLTFYCYVTKITQFFKKLKDITVPVKWKAAEATHSSNDKVCKPFY